MELTPGSRKFTVKGKDGITHLILYGTGSEGVLVPWQATFGGWISTSGTPSGADVAITASRELLRASGKKRLRIDFPPQHFLSGGFEPQENALLRLSSASTLDTNQHINLDLENPDKRFSRGNRKRTAAFFGRSGTVSLLGQDQWERAYTLLAENRIRRGVILSMSREKFLTGLNQFPDFYSLWGAFHGEELLAAAYVVQISRDTMYVLFWGDSLKGRSVSAVAPLAYQLAVIYRERGYKVLDLGISSVEGALDPGLFRFKENLGAVSTTKARIWLDLDRLSTSG